MAQDLGDSLFDKVSILKFLKWGLVTLFYIILVSYIIVSQVFPEQLFRLAVVGITSIVGFIIITFSIVVRVSGLNDALNFVENTYYRSFKVCQVILFICIFLCIISYLIDSSVDERLVFIFKQVETQVILGIIWVILLVLCFYYLNECFNSIFSLRENIQYDGVEKSEKVSDLKRQKPSNFLNAVQNWNSLTPLQKYHEIKHFLYLFVASFFCGFVVALGIIPVVIFEIIIAGVISLIGFILATFSIAITILPKNNRIGKEEDQLLLKFRSAFSATGYALLTTFFLMGIVYFLNSLPDANAFSVQVYGIVSGNYFLFRLLCCTLWVATLVSAVGKLNECFDVLVSLRKVLREPPEIHGVWKSIRLNDSDLSKDDNTRDVVIDAMNGNISLINGLSSEMDGICAWKKSKTDQKRYYLCKGESRYLVFAMVPYILLNSWDVYSQKNSPRRNSLFGKENTSKYRISYSTINDDAVNESIMPNSLRWTPNLPENSGKYIIDVDAINGKLSYAGLLQINLNDVEKKYCYTLYNFERVMANEKIDNQIIKSALNGNICSVPNTYCLEINAKYPICGMDISAARSEDAYEAIRAFCLNNHYIALYLREIKITYSVANYASEFVNISFTVDQAFGSTELLCVEYNNGKLLPPRTVTISKIDSNQENISNIMLSFTVSDSAVFAVVMHSPLTKMIPEYIQGEPVMGMLVCSDNSSILFEKIA